MVRPVRALACGSEKNNVLEYTVYYFILKNTFSIIKCKLSMLNLHAFFHLGIPAEQVSEAAALVTHPGPSPAVAVRPVDMPQRCDFLFPLVCWRGTWF